MQSCRNRPGDNEMSEEVPAFQIQQQLLSAYVRSINSAPPPAGMDADRAQLYRNLYFNNINELLSNTLPVTCHDTPERVWRTLVRQFYGLFPHTTPYFMDIAGEFVQFLAGDRAVEIGEPAYLVELAHYEWIELALSVDNTTLPEDWFSECDVLATTPRLLPASAIVAYTYPVHRMTAEMTLLPTFLLMYRDSDDAVQCVELAPAAAQLLEAVKENNDLTGEALIQQIAEQLCCCEPDFIQSARSCLQQMCMRGALVGTPCSTI